MFPWARKEKLSERHNYSDVKSITETRIQSYPSSPAHSVFSINSGQKGSCEKKVRVVLYSKSKRNAQNITCSRVETSFEKQHLMNLIDRRRQQNQIKKVEQQIFHSSKKAIKIKIQVNRTLDEYCRATKQILANNIWGQFGAASILLKMGFIEDLVADRDLVKQIWQSLDSPDQLGLYILIEQILANKVNLDMAMQTLQASLNVNKDQFSKEKASKIVYEKICKNLYDKLRINRLRRQRSLIQQ